MTDLSIEPRSPSLATGETIAQYTIVSILGAGGMSEVYRASDSRLGRDVALKILPASFGNNADRVHRFELEARATGRLNHPNIVSIFDTGEHEGRPWIVTELLEGATLSGLIRRDPQLQIRRIVSIATQIARALVAAHEKSIVHRDLKPANVFISRDGHVTVLDFGLAKLTQPAEITPGADDDTMSAAWTAAGIVVGSAGYMSPEQIEARPVDGRSDIFSFGAILYEMLTCTRAFRGDSIAGTMTAVLRDHPPDVSKIRPDAPVALAQIVRRCLAKAPEMRFQTARDLAFALEELDARSGSFSLSAAAVSAARRIANFEPNRATGVGLVAVGVIAAAIVIMSQSRSTAGGSSQAAARGAPRVSRLTTSGKLLWLIAISPDARYVVTAEQALEGSDMSLLHIPTGSSSVLVHGRSFGNATFSRDGNYVFFTRFVDPALNLYRIPLLGGDPVEIARNVYGSVSVSPDDAELAFLRTDGEKQPTSLVIVSSDGRNRRAVASWPNGKAPVECAWSPDRSRFLCSDGTSMSEINAATGATKALPRLPRIQSFTFTEDGAHVIGTTSYVGGLEIVSVDLETGAASPLTGDPGQYGALALSRNDECIAGVRVDTLINLWEIDARDGTEIRQISSAANSQDGNFGVATAPDGQIVTARNDAGRGIDLWVANKDGSSPRRLTLQDDSDEKWPAVSPDGQWVAYRRDTKSGTDLWRVNFAGGIPQQLTHTADVGAPRYTGDGHAIIYSRGLGATSRAYSIPADGGEAELVDERFAAVPDPSPDGRWIAVTTEDGRIELRPAGKREERRITPAKGRQKKWSPDGSSLAFSNGKNVSIYDVRTSEVRQLTRFGPEASAMAFAWTPSGKSIVISKRTDAADAVIIRGLK